MSVVETFTCTGLMGIIVIGNLRIEGELTSLSKFRSGSDMFYLQTVPWPAS